MTFIERKEQVKSYLGKIVDIKIDRPIGYVHNKKSYSIIYPINYGYIPNVIGGDGEELDVYLLGVTEPVTEYTCRIIGIAHRENDIEDKLIAAPIGVKYNQAEIAESVDFQEKWYKTTIEALYQKSCGAILYRKKECAVEYLLLFQANSETWSFPKGHMEKSETEKQTALREVYEETGISVSKLSDFRTAINYIIDDIIEKTVVLFIAAIEKEPCLINTNEIKRYKFVSANEAKQLLHSDYAPIIDKIDKEVASF